MSEYTYYDAINVEVFPSSNATDKGKLVSEDNLHNITLYSKIKDHIFGSDDFHLSISSGRVVVGKGIASVDGYAVNIAAPTSVQIPSTAGIYDVVLKLTFDSSHHVKGDNSGVNEGVSIEIWEQGKVPTGSEYIFKFGVLDNTNTQNPQVSNLIGLEYSIYAEDVATFEDGELKSVQDILDDLSNRYVSRQYDATKYKTLTFLKDGETGQNATDKLRLNYNYLQLFANGSEYVRTIKPNTDTYERNGNKIYKETIGNGTYLSEVSSNREDYATQQAIYGTRSSYFKYTADKILGYANNSNIVELGAASGKLYGIAYSNKTLSSTDRITFTAPAVGVNGNFSATGTITATKVYNAVYNDYAELYEKSDENEVIEPGDVIALLKDGKYGKCTERNSIMVVGVCSDNYGHLLGGYAELSLEENLKRYIPVGLAGRVKVKCNDTVFPGDLLVAGEQPGVAMSNNFPATGSVIGKALSKNIDGYVEMQIMLM